MENSTNVPVPVLALNYHVEIARKAKSSMTKANLEELVKSKLESANANDPSSINLEHKYFDDIREHVESLRVCQFNEVKDDLDANRQLSLSNGISNNHVNNSKEMKKKFEYYCFELNDDFDETEYMDCNDEEGQDAASHHWILPAKPFDGLWESLIFDVDVKNRLMEYVKTSLLFSEKGVNNSLVAFNKVILLHGPPGTGKTSLCKALAQKATIYLGKKFRYGQLVEINSHSLFSKWFSESGKLVMKMFEKIYELIEDSQSLVFLLIDEVESLAQCRLSAEAGNEPSDSIRAVNALLTQIDRIRRYPNVVILTTSNMVGSIDLAFVDRADLKIFIGAPPAEVIYEIYLSSINELIRVGIISKPESGFTEAAFTNAGEMPTSWQKKLLSLSRSSSGMSGRTLRKIPFLAHVNFVRCQSCSIDYFLNAMERSIEIEKKETSVLCRKLL